jgi:hypothetical protein
VFLGSADSFNFLIGDGPFLRECRLPQENRPLFVRGRAGILSRLSAEIAGERTAIQLRSVDSALKPPGIGAPSVRCLSVSCPPLGRGIFSLFLRH